MFSVLDPKHITRILDQSMLKTSSSANKGPVLFTRPLKGRLIFLSPQEFGVAISLPVVHNATLAIVKIVHRRLRLLT